MTSLTRGTRVPRNADGGTGVSPVLAARDDMSRPFVIILPPFAIGMICAIACYLPAGDSLGFYFGGIALAAVVIPAIAMTQQRLVDSVLAAGGVIDGVGVVWLIAAIATAATIGQWIQAYLVLLSFGLALWALTVLLRQAIGAALAAGITVLLALAWLTWPVWLSPWIGGRIGEALVAWLTPAHPLLAINRVFIDTGVWAEQRVMYRISALGQDVAYALPASVWMCVLVHAGVALAAATPMWWSPREDEQAPPPEASPAS